jgi:hypothetical protein
MADESDADDDGMPPASSVTAAANGVGAAVAVTSSTSETALADVATVGDPVSNDFDAAVTNGTTAQTSVVINTAASVNGDDVSLTRPVRTKSITVDAYQKQSDNDGNGDVGTAAATIAIAAAVKKLRRNTSSDSGISSSVSSNMAPATNPAFCSNAVTKSKVCVDCRLPGS